MLFVSTAHLFAEQFIPNLKQGDIFLATNSNYLVATTKDYQNGTTTETSEMSARLEYFIQDGWAVGGLTSIQSTPYYEFGVSTSYFFLMVDRSAIYVEPEFIIERWQKLDTTAFEMSARFGYGYFLTPSVSIGPSYRYAYRPKQDRVKSLETKRIELMLGIFI